MTTLTDKIKAADVMVREPLCVQRSTTIQELVRLFEENSISGAPVIDSQGRVVGVVSKTDLIRRCTEGSSEFAPALFFELMSDHGGADADLSRNEHICVEDFMTEYPVTVKPGTFASAVARRMYEGRIHRVVVIDEERFPVGIITSLDLLGMYPG